VIARVITFAIDGVESRRVWVEADIRSSGLPAFTIVGLADKAIREARERVRSALTNSGHTFPPGRITVNLAIDHYRSRGPARENVPLPEGGDPEPEASARRPATGDPRQALAGSELRAIFDKLAARLGAKQRAIFVMSQIEGVPTEEIARVMGISHSTVRNHLFQARRTLQEGFRQHYPEYLPKGPDKE